MREKSVLDAQMGWRGRMNHLGKMGKMGKMGKKVKMADLGHLFENEGWV